MRYFVLIVGMFLAVFMCGCDDTRNLVEPVIHDVTTPEQGIDDEQTNQLIRALIAKVAELENKVGDNSGFLLEYLELPLEQLSAERKAQVIKELTDRIEELEMELEDEISENANQGVQPPITHHDGTDDPDEDDSDKGEVVVTEPDPPEGLAIGDRVIVQNAVSADGRTSGVRIRDTPEIDPNNHRDNWLFNGATGTVIGGPVEADDFTWWEIRWDAGQREDEIICNDDPCIGWSAEIINGSVILAER